MQTQLEKGESSQILIKSSWVMMCRNHRAIMGCAHSIPFTIPKSFFCQLQLLCTLIRQKYLFITFYLKNTKKKQMYAHNWANTLTHKVVLVQLKYLIKVVTDLLKKNLGQAKEELQAVANSLDFLKIKCFFNIFSFSILYSQSPAQP
jgi:hypothetical protein